MNDFSDKYMMIEDQYKYLISQYKIYTQSEFAERYFREFGKKITQSAVAHNFKRYNIKKTKDGYYKEFPNIAYMKQLPSSALADELSYILGNNKNESEKLQDIRKVVFQYNMDDNKHSELSINQIFEELISDMVYSDRYNVVVIYFNSTNDTIIYDICATFHNSFRSKYQTLSIIPCYDTIILFSINTQEILSFCKNIKKYYHQDITGVPEF